MSGNLSPSVSGTVLPAKAPRETTDKSQPFASPLFLSEKSFLAGSCQERNDLELGLWRGGGFVCERKELKNENVWCHFTPPSPPPPPCSSSSPSCTHTHTIPFALVTARLFPVPNPFLAGPSLTVPENPTFSSVRDQSSKLSPAVVRGVTFLGSRLIRGDLPSPPGLQKKMLLLLLLLLPFVQEKTHSIPSVLFLQVST